MRKHLLFGLAVLALTSPANAQLPLAPKLVCRSVASTTCRDGYCSTQLDNEPAAQTILFFDLAKKTFAMPGLRPQPTPLTGVEFGPGSPDHKSFEAKFQIALAHGRSRRWTFSSARTTSWMHARRPAFVYPDGLIAISGYSCDRDD